MGVPLSIRASDHSVLQVGTATVQGVNVGGTTTRAALAVDTANPGLVWGDPTTGTRWRANATAQFFSSGPDRQLWADSSGQLYFRLNNTAYLVQARPYTYVGLYLDFYLNDTNVFGGSTQTLTIAQNGVPFTVPAGSTFRLTAFSVGMTRYDYSGSPSYAWRLAANAGVSGSFNGTSFNGSIDTPLAVYTAGQQVQVVADFNNIATSGAFLSGSGVLIPN